MKKSGFQKDQPSDKAGGEVSGQAVAGTKGATLGGTNFRLLDGGNQDNKATATRVRGKERG